MKDYFIENICSYCMEDCKKATHIHKCNQFVPVTNEDLDQIIDYLKEHIPPAPTRTMPRAKASSRHVNQRGDSLYFYYVSFINDTLKEIRMGNIAYAYHLWQIADLIQYEPNITVTYFDGIYYITKNL